MMRFRLWTRTGPKNHELDGIQIPHEKGQFLGKRSPIVKYRDFLPWVVQKRLNRSICRLGCGLWWSEGSTSSTVFARWRPHVPSVPRWEGMLAPPGECDWTVHLRRRRGLMSNYFDHLLWKSVVQFKNLALNNKNEYDSVTQVST